MGWQKGTAMAARDLEQMVRDAIEDLLDDWHVDDMHLGLSDEDVEHAIARCQDVYYNWNESSPTQHQLDMFLERYEHELRNRARYLAEKYGDMPAANVLEAFCPSGHALDTVKVHCSPDCTTITFHDGSSLVVSGSNVEVKRS